MGHSTASHSSLDWSTIVSDCGGGVLVVDTQGKILHINPVAARVFARRGAREAAGLKLADIFPPSAAAERLEFARQAIASGEPVLVRDLWSGVALRCTWRKIDGFADAAGPVAMMVCAQESALIEEGPDAFAKAIEAKNVDFGPLSSLTPSELRVMALIGEGMSNAQIAASLHRAVKTVESHRAALTEKTGSTSRVQLGLMARRAGLAKRVAISELDRKGERIGA